MSFSGKIRRLCFWTTDFLKKGGMYESYKEILRINNSRTEEHQKEIDARLKLLLEHVSNTTEYYRGKGNELRCFPVINKQTIIDNRTDMMSNVYKNRKLHEMHTSGSTGIPFTIQQNMEKRKRLIAEIKAMNELAHYPTHEKMLYVLGGTKKHTYTKKQQFTENIYRISVSVNSDSAMEELVAFIVKRKPWAIHASASNLPPLISYIKKHELIEKVRSVKTIVTGGEMVPDSLCEELKQVFGKKCVVAIKYSNEEMGIIAQAIDKSDEYIINVADYYVEILKMDSDEPCKDGELGRIVVTDLYNMALPMIRYDTGDIGALKKVNGMWSRIIKLSGKKRDLIYNIAGDSISGATITNLLKYVRGVKQWQLIQEGETQYRYKVTPQDKMNLPTESDLLVDDIKQLLGDGCNLILEYVENIPTIKSGKRRYTVNLWKNN